MAAADAFQGTEDQPITGNVLANDADVDGETRLPPFDPGAWREVARERHAADERHAYAMDFVTLERRSGAAAPR